MSRSAENKASDPRSRCPRCGMPRLDEDTVCPRCGGPLYRLRADWAEPSFERAWDRHRLGRPDRLLAAAGETAIALLLHPERAFGRFRLDGPVTAPLVFSFLVGAPCLLLAAAAKVLLPCGPFSGWRPPWWFLASLAVAFPAYTYLRSQVLHLAMLFLDKLRYPFTTTFRLVSYTQASAALLLLVPIAGDFLFVALGAVVEILALQHGEGFSLRDGLILELVPAVLFGLSLLAVGVLGLLWWSFVNR